MLVKITSSEAMVEREPPEIIPELPRLHPFDVSVIFDHMLNKDAWRSDLKIPEIDITIVPPATELASSSISRDACPREFGLSLRESEKKNFCCDGKTDKQSGTSCSGDEIMGLIERDVPAAITPHGHTSPLFNRPLYGHNTEPHRIFRDRPKTSICKDSERCTRVPHNILVGQTPSGEPHTVLVIREQFSK